MNNIPTTQNEQKQLERLAAQRELYTSAKNRQRLQIFLNVLVAVPFSTISIWHQDLAPISASYGIVVALIDILFLEVTINHLKEKAAKIQEMFDCDVMELQCSPLKTVDNVTVEEILVYYDAHKKIPTNIEKIRNWYSPSVGELPLEIGRLICQRSNCWWDSNLRIRLTKWIRGFSITVCFLIFVIALWKNLDFVTLILILSGLFPFFQYCAKNYLDQVSAANRLNELMSFINSLWNKALSGSTPLSELTESSRRIQDEIFEHRARSPLVLNFFYWMLRNKDEEIMNRASELLVKEAKSKLRI